MLANLTMLQQFAGIENVIGLYWTLQIELIFYGLCVLLFCAGSSSGRAASPAPPWRCWARPS